MIEIEVPRPPVVLLDANVLAPLWLHDTLLWIAYEGELFAPIWTPTILSETRRALIDDWHLTEERADRRVAQMEASFPEAIIADADPSSVPGGVHPGDRHVVAAALTEAADIICTDNVNHMAPAELIKLGIEVLPADRFLIRMWESNPDAVLASVRALIGSKRRPPVAPADYLARMRKARATVFAEALAVYL